MDFDLQEKMNGLIMGSVRIRWELTSTQFYSLVLKSLTNAESGGASFLGCWKVIAYLLMVPQLYFRESNCFANAERVFKFCR